MKIKSFAASLLTVASLALVTLGSTSNVQAATVATQATSGVLYINNASGAQIYGTPTTESGIATTGASLVNDSAWQYTKAASVNGELFYAVGKNQWIKASDTSSKPATQASTQMNKIMYVKANGNVNLYSAANGGYFTGNTVIGGYGYTVYESTTDDNGQIWYNVGQNQWVNGQYMSDDNVTQTLTMNATAYDPAVLGSNMGYSGVAANLSKFPKGTHLRITDGNGTVYDRVVNDTGLFAYSNPNQLDIAMPNSQALSFGRQNVTVEVLG
ncbi:SLAP domain-containing protein [Companilactobacillus jidongensis]|uniref:SLAP domain-containing protein n=1 Tax=Companilactobacillus jidongensis TaxID=2486006 RepID=UPI000F7A4F7D|nr:SLAP domain-containing protein [Companilactobacillus jidongensis]